MKKKTRDRLFVKPNKNVPLEIEREEFIEHLSTLDDLLELSVASHDFAKRTCESRRELIHRVQKIKARLLEKLLIYERYLTFNCTDKHSAAN